MSDNQEAEAYLHKASESLAGAECEHSYGRYNNRANRAYYAAFPGAISALLREGIRAGDGHWAHRFVQSEFAGKLINGRRRYPSGPRDTLAELQALRHRVDTGRYTTRRYQPPRRFTSCAALALRLTTDTA